MEPDNGAKFSERVLELRRRLALTQSQLADKLGVSPLTVHRWEHAVSRPHRVFIQKLKELADGR